MSDVPGKGSLLETSADRRNFLEVASRACCAYLPVAGSVSGLIFSTYITNPRILERWAIIEFTRRMFHFTLLFSGRGIVRLGSYGRVVLGDTNRAYAWCARGVPGNRTSPHITAH